MRWNTRYLSKYICPRGFRWFFFRTGVIASRKWPCVQFSRLTLAADSIEANRFRERQPTERWRVRRQTIRYPRQTTSDTDTDAIHGETQKMPQHQTNAGRLHVRIHRRVPQSLPPCAGGPRPQPAAHLTRITRLECLPPGRSRMHVVGVRWQSPTSVRRGIQREVLRFGIGHGERQLRVVDVKRCGGVLSDSEMRFGPCAAGEATGLGER